MRGLPVLLGVALALIGFVSQVDFRGRDELQSLQGRADLQIVMELGIWSLVLLFLVAAPLRSGKPPILLQPRRLPAPMRLLGLYALLVAASSLYSPSQPVAIVRGVQWLAFFAAAVLVYERLPDTASLTVSWLASRRTLWFLAGGAMTVTAIAPNWNAFVTVSTGEIRYTLLETHPVGSGLILGLTTLTVVGTFLGTPDPAFRGRNGRVLQLMTLAVLTGALVATKTRGAIFGTLAATLVLVWLNPDRRVRRFSLLLLGTGGLLFILDIGDVFIDTFITRQQRAEQLLSLTGRTDLISEAWPLVEARPWFGHGFLAARSLLLNVAFGAGEAHNLWLEVVLSTGLIGVLLLVAFLIRLVRLQMRTLRVAPIRLRTLTVESLALLTFVLVDGLVTDGFAGAAGTDTLALMWAMVIACASAEHAADPPSLSSI